MEVHYEELKVDANYLDCFPDLQFEAELRRETLSSMDDTAEKSHNEKRK